MDRAGARLADNCSIRKCRYEVLSGISVLGWLPHLLLLRARSTNGGAAALLRSNGRRDQPSGQEGRGQEDGDKPDVVCQPDCATDRNNVPLAESNTLAKSGGFAEPDAFACQPMMPTRQAPLPKCRGDSSPAGDQLVGREKARLAGKRTCN